MKLFEPPDSRYVEDEAPRASGGIGHGAPAE